MSPFLDGIDPNEYAATMMRAAALTGHEHGAEEGEAIGAALMALQKAGLGSRFVRVVHAGGVIKWLLTIITPRGNLEFLLDDPSDWKRELEDAGLL